MSASVFWRPVAPKEGKRVGTFAPSRFLTELEAAFGSRNPTLERSDVPILRGMAAVYDGNQPNPYTELADAVEKHDAVEVWAEY